MKIIFLLALLIFVGAQKDDDNSSGDEDDSTNNDEGDQRNSDEDYTDNISNDDNNDDMSDEDTKSKKYRSGGGGSSPETKEMLEKLTNICVDVKFPKEVIDAFKACLKEEAVLQSDILDNMLEGKFPDREEISKFFESLERCKLKSGGIEDLDKDYTKENLMKFAMYDKWTGDKQDKEELRQSIITCFDEAQGSGFEKVINHHKCLTEYHLRKCRENDEEPGLLLRLMIKILTLYEDSKCAPVKVSKEHKQIRDECMEEAKQVFKNSPDSSANFPSMSKLPEKFAKFGKLWGHFIKNYLVRGVFECTGKKTGMYSAETKLLNISSFAESIKQYEGWNGLEQERELVYKAIMECGREYDVEVENESDEKYKDLMEDSDDFDSCFTPKFAKICGFNNELGTAFDPMMDPEFLGKVFEAFKEVGGKEGEDTIALLKGLLKKLRST